LLLTFTKKLINSILYLLIKVFFMVSLSNVFSSKKAFFAFFALAVFIAGSLLLAGCATPATDNSGQGKIKVAVDIYPYEFLVKQIGGDKVGVSRLFPDGVEPHTYEPSPQDIVSVQQSDIFIYNGQALNSFESQIVKDLPSGTVVVSASDGLGLIAAGSSDGEASTGSNGISYNPHIWLDPQNMIIISRHIESALENASPSDAQYFKANEAALVSRLESLDSSLSRESASFSKRQYVGFHPAFNYFNRRYNLSYAANIEEIAGIEPSAQEMAGIIDIVRANNISAIYAEPLFDPRSAEAISKNSGAQVLYLDPLASLLPEKKQQGMDYFSIMRENMDSLAKSLGD